MIPGTETRLRWPQRLAVRLHNVALLPNSLLAWLTKERKIGGRMDVWVALALLAGGMVVFKALPYIDRKAGTDIAGNVAGIVPVLIAGSLIGLLGWIMSKNNFLSLSCAQEQALLEKAGDSWILLFKYIAATLIDRLTWLALVFLMFPAAVGK